MKISTMKIIGFGILSVLAMAGGLVFAAWFAVDQLQSWLKALMEARVVVYGQIILGVSIGLASGKWRGRLGLVVVVVMMAALFGFAWAIASTPVDRFWLLLSGMVAYILIGGTFFAEFIRATKELRSRPRTVHPPAPKVAGGDPSLN